MIRRIASMVLALVSLPLLLTCGGKSSGTGPLPPDPGKVEIRLATPNTDDGIMRIVVTGGAVTDAGSGPYEAQFAAFGADSTVIVVRGALATGTVAELTLPDRNVLASYTARVTQAASRQTYELQQNLAGYHLSLVKP